LRRRAGGPGPEDPDRHLGRRRRRGRPRHPLPGGRAAPARLGFPAKGLTGRPGVQGLVYHLSLPRIAAARLLGRRLPWLLYGPLGPGRLETLPEPALPGDDWALVRPLLAGVCGTDLGVITAQTSPSASPFSSFPAVLGHEVVGRIERSGPGVSLPPGARVVVDPSISCEI